MKKTLIVLLFIITFSSNVLAETSRLTSIVNAHRASKTTIGVSLHDIKTGKEIFSHNAHKALNPASTMKVVTSVVALSKLGGSYKYVTPITTDKISNKTAYNLYIKGFGDPSIVEERLWRMAKDIKVRGINRIEGNIIIDNSYFDGFDFSGKDDSSSRAYNAKLSAFALNFNSFAIVAKNFGGRLEVHVDPPTDYFSLKSTVKRSGNSLSISRSHSNNIEYVRAAGGVSKEKIKYANVSDPVQYAGTTLAWVLKQLGVEFNGKTRAGNAKGKLILVKDKSKALSLILRDLNKYSNNFTAEMVLKTLAAHKIQVPGSTENGVKLLKTYLSGLGIEASEYAIYNGSGLSRRNRLSPYTLTKVLLDAHKNNKIRSDFMASLSIGGTDGTLERRLRSTELNGNVKAKTGTLNDVASLSGYIETKSKRMLAFTIIVNGPAAGAGGFFGLQEKILLNVYRNY